MKEQEVNLKKRIPWNKGKTISKEYRKKISKAIKINAMNNPNFGFKGKHHSKETKEKLSKSLKLFTSKPDIKAKMSQVARKLWRNQAFREKMKNAGMRGRKHSKETKEKMSESHKGQGFWSKGHIPWNKGIPCTEEQKRKISKTLKERWQSLKSQRKIDRIYKNVLSKSKKKVNKILKGKCGVFKRTKEFREKQSEIMKIIMNSPKTKIKERIAWERRAESSSYPKNYLCPNFNFKSVYIFEALDKVLFTKSRYGGTRAGEKKIGRYFVDYFNFKYRFIVEWNEDSHYGLDGYLLEKDIEKCRYILAIYPNWIYITIKESDWFKSKELTKKIKISILECILSEILAKNPKKLKKNKKI